MIILYVLFIERYDVFSFCNKNLRTREVIKETIKNTSMYIVSSIYVSVILSKTVTYNTKVVKLLKYIINEVIKTAKIE